MIRRFSGNGLWTQNRTIIILLVVLLVALAAVVTAQQQWQTPRLQGLITEQNQSQQLLRSNQRRHQDLALPLSRAQQLDENLAWFRQFVPLERDLPVFLGELFDWARQARLDIDRISYQAGLDKDSGLLRYDLNFSIKGEYPQIKRFIHLLEGSERILLIEQIAMASATMNQQHREIVDLRIELATFFTKDLQ